MWVLGNSSPLQEQYVQRHHFSLIKWKKKAVIFFKKKTGWEDESVSKSVCLASLRTWVYFKKQKQNKAEIWKHGENMSQHIKALTSKPDHEFDPWDPRRELTPVNCPLIHTDTAWHGCTHTQEPDGMICQGWGRQDTSGDRFIQLLFKVRMQSLPSLVVPIDWPSW